MCIQDHIHNKVQLDFDFSITEKIFIFVFYFYIFNHVLNASKVISAIHDKIIVLSPFLGLNGSEIAHTLSLLFNKMLDIISFTMGKKEAWSNEKTCDIKKQEGYLIFTN